MSRSNKVKRYKQIYNDPKKKRKKILKTFLAIVACGILVFVGYSAYQPIVTFLNGDMTYDTSQDYPASSISSRPALTTSEGSATTSSNSQEISEDLKSLFIPTASVKNATTFENFLTNAKEKGYTSIILEAKDNSGIVHYQSSVPQVAQSTAQATDAYPLAERIASIKAAGLKPVVRLVTFEDNTASRILESSFVMYRGSSEYRWLDNSPEAGGRGWLSPESAAAQTYITALSDEIVSMGCDTLLLASFQYPTGVGTNLAYGGPQSDVSKMAVLQTYAKALIESLGAKKATCYMETPVESILNGDDVRYGGNPVDIGFKKIAPQIYPSSLPSPLVVGSESIPVPKDAPYETTKLVVKQMKSIAAGKVENFFPLLQCYDGYETGGVKEQERAIADEGIKNYILYDPSGVYY